MSVDRWRLKRHENFTVLDLDRKLDQRCSFAGAVDANTVMNLKQGDMVGAENVFLFSVKKLALFKIQRQAAMRAAVFINMHGIALADRHDP
jgi:hypothetical protein